MITIKHDRATFTVKPEHAQTTHDLLALIDKSKGKRGPKLSKGENRGARISKTREYPKFFAGMKTADYLSRYASYNGHTMFKPTDYIHADRAAPALDPSYSEVVEELC